MNSKSLVLKRLIVYLVGVFIVAVATRLSVVANLGLGCGAALAKVLAELGDVSFSIGFFSMDSLSVWMFIVAIIVCVSQVFILGKEFKISSLLQLVFAFVFSIFISYAHPLVAWWVPSAYWVRYVQLAISVALTGLGIFMVVTAKLVAMPPESLALAIIKRFHKGSVGTWRTAYDVSNLVLAIILGWIVVGNPLFTVREGTIITAFCTGFFVDIFMKLIGKPVGIFCNGREGYEEQMRLNAKIAEEKKAAKAAKKAVK